MIIDVRRFTVSRIQGSAMGVESSSGNCRMNRPLSQASLWTSKMAGERLDPAKVEASTSLLEGELLFLRYPGSS